MTLKPLFLRLHRWIALGFALPLLVVIGTGLVLAFEPALKVLAPAGTVTLERLSAVMDAAGPAAANGSLFVRAYDGTATLGGRAAAQTFDLATATPAPAGALAGVFLVSRRLHETLLLDLGWLVTASTIALLALAPFGLLLGWPKLRNTIGGWHRLAGWALLPLLVGSPLTGLALAFGISLAAPAAPPAGAPLPLRETLQLVAQRHDVAGLDFVRSMGGGMRLVRVLDATGTSVTYRATTAGLQPMPSNWPRILHEGGWGGVAGSLANLVAAVGLAGLLGTGSWLWVRRTIKRRATPRRVRVRPGATAASG
jgi:uncharacterized iron-regulated membrane protein